jgi:hypothetical protein
LHKFRKLKYLDLIYWDSVFDPDEVMESISGLRGLQHLGNILFCRREGRREEDGGRREEGGWRMKEREEEGEGRRKTCAEFFLIRNLGISNSMNASKFPPVTSMTLWAFYWNSTVINTIISSTRKPPPRPLPSTLRPPPSALRPTLSSLLPPPPALRPPPLPSTTLCPSTPHSPPLENILTLIRNS